MSAKKNLTVAALAALLAVPAFGATNASHALHIPSVTAHADKIGDSPALVRYDHMSGALENQDGSGFNKEIGGTIQAPDVNPHPVTAYRNGHTLTVVPNDSTPGRITAVDGQPVSSQAQVLSLLNSNKNTNHSNQSNNNSSDATDSNSNANGSTQYASKSSLPQTGESNGNSKAMAMGAVALGASASMMALSMAKKHRQESELDSVSSEPTVDNDDSNGDDKSNDDDTDDIDTGYHMIMSDMFDNISKDLKQM